MKKKQKPAPPSGSFIFGAAPNGILSEEEARDVVGPALLALAETHKVGEVRHLTKQMIFDAVDGNPRHPLYKFVFHCSPEEAAKSYFLQRCGILMRAVVYTPLHLAGKSFSRERIVVPASEVLQHATGGGYTRRPAHAFAPDALKDDVVFGSVLNGALKRLFTAFEWAERWCSKRPVPPEVEALLLAVRAAIDDFKQSTKDAAAE